eukprot:4792492-Pleurochrysis_carterae.AAC.1
MWRLEEQRRSVSNSGRQRSAIVSDNEGCTVEYAYSRHHPVRVTGGRASPRNVHNDIAQGQKRPRRQRLGEEVGEIVRAVD